MPECTYCFEPATTKRKVYDADINGTIEVDVCQECADWLDEGGYNNPEPYDPM